MNRNKNKKSLISSIMLLCVIIVVITASSIGFNAILTVKSLSKSSYSTYEQAVNNGYYTEIKSQVQSTISVIQSEYNKYQAGEKTEEKAKEDAKETIRIMRYRDDQSGYFWIDDTDYILIMHPILTENEGKNRYELTDQNGVMIIQEIMKVCQSPEKGGYNEFYFTKADGMTVAPKIAYSQIFEPWGWVVSTGNYVDDMNLEMSETSAKINASYGSTLTRINIVFIFTIALALLIAFLYGKQIVKPLKAMQTFADTLATGNLTTSVDIKQNNEIGRTASALMVAQNNMRNLLLQINEVVDGVTSALTQFDATFSNMKNSISDVSTAIDSIANNVTEQASSTDEASNEASVMGNNIDQTGHELRTLDQNANDMKQLSEKSMDTLKQLIKVSDKTQNDIHVMYEQTQATSQSVNQIQLAANLINEISDQTSLLALNASIEAARAGESGRGFAVVADEIGKLAQQSTNSVEEIRKIVEELLKNATQSVDIMDEISNAIHMQVSSISDTQQSFSLLYEELNNCVNAVRTIDTMTGNINDQRCEVTKALDTLNHLAQDNATMTEETAAMSIELSQAVEDSTTIITELEQKVTLLTEDVHKFTL